MRIVARVLCAAFLAAVVFFTVKKLGKTPARTEVDSPAPVSSPTIPQESVVTNTPPIFATTNPVEKISEPTNSVEARIENLENLGSASDAESLQKIIAAFDDADSKVRKAAVEAATQFGSRDAIPALQDLEKRVEDPREKVEILDAIEFLKLPSLSEIRNSRRNQ
jgi:hypothetical protein